MTKSNIDKIVDIISSSLVVVCSTCKKNDELWHSDLSGWCCTRCYDEPKPIATKEGKLSWTTKDFWRRSKILKLINRHKHINLGHKTK